MTPEVLGSSAATDSASEKNTTTNTCTSSTNSESTFVQNYIKEYLTKHTTCVHFLDAPISYTGAESSLTCHKYSIVVKQLHLDRHITFTLTPPVSLADVVSAYENEMNKMDLSPIPAAEQRWLYKGKPLLTSSVSLSSISPSMNITFHLVRKATTTATSKSELELAKALRAFNSERSSGQNYHSCTDPRCTSSINFLLEHLKE